MRVTRTAFWTWWSCWSRRLAFGLAGLEVRQVIRDECDGIVGMIGSAVVAFVLVFSVRFAWLDMRSREPFPSRFQLIVIA